MPFIHQALLYQSLIVSQTLSYPLVNLSANYRSWCNTDQSRLLCPYIAFQAFKRLLDTSSHLISPTVLTDHTKQMTSLSLNTKSHNRVLTLLLNSEASSSRHFNSHLQNSFELFPFPVSLVVLCPQITSRTAAPSKGASLPAKITLIEGLAEMP